MSFICQLNNVKRKGEKERLETAFREKEEGWVGIGGGMLGGGGKRQRQRAGERQRYIKEEDEERERERERERYCHLFRCVENGDGDPRNSFPLIDKVCHPQRGSERESK